MMDIREKIEELTRRIDEMALRQSGISNQLAQLTAELNALKRQAGADVASSGKSVKPVEHTPPVTVPATPAPAGVKRPEKPAAKKISTFEEFIGKNLASKIGILVTIAGIFIGARYAIEHNLVSPLIRIVAGYLSGIILMVLALFLRKKYEGHSAVLLGGALAVFYFITFTAYSYYSLIPQSASFVLMVAFTASAVYAALVYNRVIIAHLGLVAAYAIPFLLSDHSGRYGMLFSYITIINAGILAISFRKNWKSLFHVAFGTTWLIYLVWHVAVREAQHFNMAFGFSSLYFVMFYLTFLAYNLVRRERYGTETVAILLSNSFIYYGLGFELVHKNGTAWINPGLFTLVNAGVHLLVSQLIRPRVADKALYFLVLGLTLVFITITIPVQFDGNSVTLLWTAEALLLFVVGRRRQEPGYEKLSAVLMPLGFFSLMHDWFVHAYSFLSPNNNVQPFANIVFVCGLLVLLAFGAMAYIYQSKKYPSTIPAGSLFRGYFDYSLAILLLLTAYFVFYAELEGYFNSIGRQVQGADGSFVLWHDEIIAFRALVLLLYSMVFGAVVITVNRRWVRSRPLSAASLAGTVLLILFLLWDAMPVLNERARQYYQLHTTTYFGFWNLVIRYIMAAAMAALLYMGRHTMRCLTAEPFLQKGWPLITHTAVLGMLSGEYLLWAGMGGSDSQSKLGLSILWGVYALFLIVAGIRWRQKWLRLAAIGLFSITLIKLFVYDLAEAGTVTKTISFISLGVILLLVSYLYNRYKEVLFEDKS